MSVGPLISFVLKKLEPAITAVEDFDKNILTLQTKFEAVQNVVDDAEQSQVSNKRAQTWVSQLKDIAYDVDDILDEWNTELQKRKRMEDKDEMGLIKKARKLHISTSKIVTPFFANNHIANRVNKILEKLERIDRLRSQFGSNKAESKSSVGSRLETSSLIDTAEIYGREEDRKTLLEKLLAEGALQVSHASVICIVGTGGFGKTTLSQLVFDDNEVKFQKKMWVCVSKDVDWNKVAKKIISEAGEDVPNSDVWQSLHRSLFDALKGKKFFLVLDDVWEFDDDRWRQLKYCLDGGSQGSMVLVTTRDESIARRMSSSYTHRLKGLSDDDCWKLIGSRALVGKENPERFEEIRKEIAKKCRGVPLAARILSSLMLEKESEQDWRGVLDSNIWEVTEAERGGLRPELLLSYYAMPEGMRQCFVYCAMFPEDTWMQKDYVVKLWMAEGLISDNGTGNLEKIGSGYFDGLAMRSFFQDFKMVNGNLVECKMHDLLHDFAWFLMHGSKNSKEKERIRYLHIKEEEEEKKKEPSSEQLKRLRTLVYSCVTSLQNSKRLRVLHLRSCKILDRFPKNVGDLLHLRYLGLNELQISELPESLCDLLNLQTLNLDGCYNLISLPKKMGKLSNLRHLQLEETDKLEHFPESVAELGNLRTLSKFIVGDKSNSLKIGGLKLLNHLQGSLEIFGLERISDVNEVFEAELKMKKNLSSVTFDFNIKSHIVAMVGLRRREEKAIENDDPYRDKTEFEFESEDEDELLTEEGKIVLNGLEPPEGLKELEIRSYHGREFPSWISLLSNLVMLALINCDAYESLPCLGNLAFLEYLTLHGSFSVNLIGKEFYGVNSENKDLFPRLKKLTISHFGELIEWEFPWEILHLDDKKIMPRLSKLDIYDCPQLQLLPYQAHDNAFPALSELKIRRCGSQLLKGAGKLKSLKILRLEELTSLECLDEELSQISEETKLEYLTITKMENWKEWNLQSGIDVYSSLVKLEIVSCKSLVELPALGGLKNLEILSLRSLESVTNVGEDFLGMSNSNDQRTPRFPKLQNLEFIDMPEWEKWEVPFEDNKTKFFPKLTWLYIRNCSKLSALPALGKLNSLQDLELCGLHEIEHLGTEFLGISSNYDGDQDVRFPKLTNLSITQMNNWGWDAEIMETDQNLRMEIMPCLEKLILGICVVLTVIPSYMFSSSLKKLVMIDCPSLSGRQPQLPSHLEELQLFFDPGVFSTSLPIGNSYHKLRDVKLHKSECKVLPQGFDQFTAIQSLEISECDHLDFSPENFRQLSSLRSLLIVKCSILSKSCIKGENWGLHIPEICIDGKPTKVSYHMDIQSRKRKEKDEKERKDKHAKKSDSTA